MNLILQLICTVLLVSRIEVYGIELYDVANENSDVLPRGVGAWQFVKLDVPVHLYTDKYDLVYVNTNGLLTFGNEFPEFVNLPFPLEVPAIAPFYSNVDTTLKNDSALVSFYKTHDPNLLGRAEILVRQSFSDAIDFKPDALFVATWENVGHYDRKNDLTNTFQVVLICAQEETYVQFLYPKNGINWIQGETGESGLPDIRAQAGFVSEDLRHYLLRDSGTDNIRHITEGSNVNNPGEWLYRVGPLGQTDNVQEPDLFKTGITEREPRSCEDGGSFKCHSRAMCKDTSTGFCCVCKDGYYGDGLICIKNDVPMRVSGQLTGNVGGVDVGQVALQSYVVMAEGRTYTALSPLEQNVGLKLQLAQAVGGTLGWLFAKPIKNTRNGFQLTGGKFNSSITIRFEETNQSFYIKQNYIGLNVWDQLAADVEISGDIPDIARGTRPQIHDFTQEYTQTRNEIRATSRHTIQLPEEHRNISFNVYQEIKFEQCKYAESGETDQHGTGTLKSTRNTVSYDTRESAVRIGAVNKIGETSSLNPCDDESYQCGPNTICVATSEDAYDCVCLNGFTYASYSDDRITTCVDIDECNSGYNTCSENARCINEPGTFRCQCNPGYDGNGYQCDPIKRRDSADTHRPTMHPSHSEHHYHQEEYDYREDGYSRTEDYSRTDDHSNRDDHHHREETCQYCSPHAACVNGRCKCNFGYHGTGQECAYNCPNDLVWDGNTCQPISQPEEYETEPHCTIQGCECPAGYLLKYVDDKDICQLEDSEADDQSAVSCDIENRCSGYATCAWNEILSKYECVCNPGYHGDGIDCREKETSCVEQDLCDEHAQCLYNDQTRKSECICEPGYEGDGKFCHLAPECSANEECGEHSHCDEGGLCMCDDGYERDFSDFCVPTGSCEGVYCAENAICKWNHVQKVKYCHCPEGFVGDGIRSCKSVPPPCNVRNNCGLYASCRPDGRHEYHCICDPGYDGDGFVCTPERNCRNIPSMCDRNADCESTTSGWQCICRTGYLGNGTECHDVPKVDNGFLFFSQGVALVRVPFTGRQGRPVAISQMAIGVDKDCAEGKLYFSDITAKAIYSVGYDGLGLQVFLKEDIVSPEGIAIDWISRRIYWTDSGKDTIEVASLEDPSKRAVLINKHLVNPRGIAVDPGKYLFWSDWDRNGPKIEFSNLDGSGRQLLLTTPHVILPNSLVIHPHTGDLCYADAGTKKIDCVDVYTKTPRNIAQNLSYPFGLAATDDQFYWTDWSTKKIESIDLYGNRKGSINSPLFGSHKMYGSVAVTDRCPLYHSPCIRPPNGGCSDDRICLTNPISPSGISCKCINNKICNEASSDVVF